MTNLKKKNDARKLRKVKSPARRGKIPVSVIKKSVSKITRLREAIDS